MALRTVSGTRVAVQLVPECRYFMPMCIRSITLVVSESDIWCSSRETQKALSGSSNLRTWGSSERSGPLSGDPRGSKATRSRHATFMTRVYLSSGCFIWSTPYCGLRHGSAVVSSPDRCRGSVVGRVLTSQAVVVTVQDGISLLDRFALLIPKTRFRDGKTRQHCLLLDYYCANWRQPMAVVALSAKRGS